jgi:fatty acid amide hydrolase
MARTVSDVALGIEVANGGRNPNVEPPMPLGDFKTVDVSKLRIAYYTDDGTFQVAPAVRRAVRESADILRALGAQVSDWTPPDVCHALDLFFGILSADRFSSGTRTLGKNKRDPRIAAIEQIGTKSRGAVTLITKLLGALGQHHTVSVARNYGHGDTAHYWDLVEAQLAYQQRFAEALDQEAFDAIVCPAFALPALTHGASQDLITAGAYTPLYNVLGYPTGIVPFTRVRADEAVGRAPSKDKMLQTAYDVEQGSAGLPIGVQVAARPWREHVALAVMSAIEQTARARSDFPQTPL